MRIYRIQHAFILAVKELTFSVNCWMQITSFVLLRRTLFGCNEEKKTHLRERKFLTPLLSRRPLLFQSNINFKVIVHAVMGKQRGIVTLCYYIEPSQYGSMNYSSNGQIIYIVKGRHCCLGHKRCTCSFTFFLVYWSLIFAN